MFNWFIDTFQQSSERASLVTTLIATSIALVVVVLTHLFVLRRDRFDLLQKKREEFFNAILELEDNIARYSTSAFNGGYKTTIENGENYYEMSPELDEKLEILLKKFRVVKMLSSLYFPKHFAELHDIELQFTLQAGYLRISETEMDKFIEDFMTSYGAAKFRLIKMSQSLVNMRFKKN